MIKIGCPQNILVEPFLFGMRHSLLEHPFEFIEGSDREIGKELGSQTIAYGLISPYQYARSKGGIKIVKNFVISRCGGSLNSVLFFKENLDRIDKIHFRPNPRFPFYQFLGEMVLKEIFNITAEWRALEESEKATDVLENYPAVFLSGYEALWASSKSDKYLDLSEEWILKSGLPLPHYLLAVNEDYDIADDLEIFQKSLDLGLGEIEKIAAEYAEKLDLSPDFLFKYLTTSMRFIPDPDDWDALRELLSYLFYYGKAEFIPEIRFAGEG